MTVSPVPFEPSRFWVSSESRADVEHLVDLDWRDEKWMKPKALCSCEQMQCKDKRTCKHLFAVVDYLKSHDNSQP